MSDFFVFEQLQKDILYHNQTLNAGTTKYDLYNKTITDKVNTNVDKRYRSFINAELVDNKFPKNINFVSWNYDVQIELAYARITGISLYLAQQELQVFPAPNTVRGITLSNSSIIKLNGTAGIYYSDRFMKSLENVIDQNLKWDDNNLILMAENYSRNNNRMSFGIPFFTFSFEDQTSNSLSENSINYAKEILSKTEILIVIGYSFHSLNRKIDKAIFENAEKIEQVIFQLREEDFSSVKYNFSRVYQEIKNIIPYYNLDEFHASNNV